jgi:hypothetical protein
VTETFDRSNRIKLGDVFGFAVAAAHEEVESLLVLLLEVKDI